MKIRVGNKKSHGARCFASGGRVSEDISDKGALPKVMGGAAEGGVIDGDRAKPRLDRSAKKPATTVNVTVVSGGQKPPMPMPPMGAPAPAPMGPPPAPPMAGPPMPPPGMGGGMPPGMPMRKHGGRVQKKADGGPVAGYLRGRAASKMWDSNLGEGLMDDDVAKQDDRDFRKFKGAADKFSKTGLPGKPSGDDKDNGRKRGGRVQKKADGGNVSADYENSSENIQHGDEQVLDGIVRAVRGKESRNLAQNGNVDRSKIEDEGPTPRPTMKANYSKVRKNGGRVNMKDGAGGGLGRLEKAKDYGGKPGNVR